MNLIQRPDIWLLTHIIVLYQVIFAEYTKRKINLLIAKIQERERVKTITDVRYRENYESRNYPCKREASIARKLAKHEYT